MTVILDAHGREVKPPVPEQFAVAKEWDGRPLARPHKGRDRNGPCRCGSGRKAKRCCG